MVDLVILTILLTVFQYFCIWISVFPLQELFSSFSVRFQLVLLHIFLFWFLFCYYLSCSKDPGFCLENWMPNKLKHFLQKDPQLCTSFHRTNYKASCRYCKHCKLFKPPRAHHCKTCNRCVLRMDHHCTWINNCVGLHNHKYFLLFLFYGTITVGIAEILFITSLFHALWCGGYQWYHWTLFLVWNLPINTVALIFLFATLIQNVLVVLHNKTAIEIWEVQWAEEDCRAVGFTYRYPYDRGLWNNICEFLGPSFLLWFIPIDNIQLSGLDFEPLVSEEFERFEEMKEKKSEKIN